MLLSVSFCTFADATIYPDGVAASSRWASGSPEQGGGPFPLYIIYLFSIMAKGSAMGMWRGKKGSSVFYRIKNSNSAQKQGIRERVYEVSNPKSASQAAQRMKMLPAQRLASVLKGVIERGFEGVPYGVLSRNQFLKYALKMTAGVPATDKDASQVYPGKYLISKGQLPEIIVADGARSSVMVTSLRYSTEEVMPENRGDVSRLLLSANKFLQEGDQITIVTCYFDGSSLDGAALIWNQNSYYLDTEGTEEIGDDFQPGIASLDDEFASILAPSVTGNETLLAGAVIISRESATGGHLRSNATLHINSAFDSELFGAAALSRARKSYQKSTVSNSDWPVDPDAEGEVDPERVRMARVTIDVSDTTNGTIRVSVPSLPDLVYEDIAMSSAEQEVTINLPIGYDSKLQFIQSTTGASYCSFDNWVIGGENVTDNPATVNISGATEITLNTTVVERG